MGTWGTKIFDGDLESDLRAEFRDGIAAGGSPDEVTDRLLTDWAGTFSDPEDGPTAWLALAEAQRESGRLVPMVKDRATTLLDAGEDLPRWRVQAPNLVDRRARVLRTLRRKLDQPLPPARRIRAPRRHETELEAGDLLAFRLRVGVYVGLWVAEVHVDKGGKAPVVVPLERAFPHPPAARDLLELRACWGRHRDPVYGGRWLGHIIFDLRRADDPGRRYRRVARGVTPAGDGERPLGLVTRLTDPRLPVFLAGAILQFRCCAQCTRCPRYGVDPALPELLDGLLPTQPARDRYGEVALDGDGVCDACR